MQQQSEVLEDTKDKLKSAEEEVRSQRRHLETVESKLNITDSESRDLKKELNHKNEIVQQLTVSCCTICEVLTASVLRHSFLVWNLIKFYDFIIHSCFIVLSSV